VNVLWVVLALAACGALFTLLDRARTRPVADAPDRGSTTSPAAGHLVFADPESDLRVYLQVDASGREVVTLANAPPYVHALEMAPARREPELDRGDWLVLVFAVASVPDVRAVREAVKAGRVFGGRVQVGVRPFGDYDETEAWCGSYGGTRESPLWLVLRDGRVVYREWGTRTAGQVELFVRTALGL
jgi:hypothetical protein